MRVVLAGTHKPSCKSPIVDVNGNELYLDKLQKSIVDELSPFYWSEEQNNCNNKIKNNDNIDNNNNNNNNDFYWSHGKQNDTSKYEKEDLLSSHDLNNLNQLLNEMESWTGLHNNDDVDDNGVFNNNEDDNNDDNSDNDIDDNLNYCRKVLFISYNRNENDCSTTVTNNIDCNNNHMCNVYNNNNNNRQHEIYNNDSNSNSNSSSSSNNEINLDEFHDFNNENMLEGDTQRTPTCRTRVETFEVHCDDEGQADEERFVRLLQENNTSEYIKVRLPCHIDTECLRRLLRHNDTPECRRREIPKTMAEFVV